MGMLTAAYSNNSSSIFQARNDRYIDDILAAPMRAWQVDIGLTIGGVLRALAIGIVTTAIAAPLLGVPIEHPLLLVVAVARGDPAVCLARPDRRHLRPDVGPQRVRPEPRDPAAHVRRRGLLLGRHPAVAVASAHAREPALLHRGRIRYGFLGTSDVAPAIAISGSRSCSRRRCSAWSVWLFRSGHKLKP